jgi:uncharacterized NAD-dependent epimerase/dehydratase family protein
VSSPRRFVILAEGYSGDSHYGKTARGLLRYCPHEVVAVLDSDRAGSTLMGVPVVASVEEALTFKPNTAIVGVATQGGRFPAAWRPLLRDCILAGLDLENGLHEFLSEDRELVELAGRQGVSLRDLRKPPADLNVPTGANLSHDSTVVLTVGSDCAVGKMTVSLELDRESRERGLKSVFVPTGQTGVAIAGWGLSVDAVVSDFVAGASERLVLEGVARGGAILQVEGQGSLLHPAYSGVTLGLLHGAAPHMLVLCHRLGLEEIDDDPRFPLPPLTDLVELYERSTLIPRRARVVAIALNTATVDEADALEAIERIGLETGLPADDPVRFGPAKLTSAVLAGVA